MAYDVTVMVVDDAKEDRLLVRYHLKKMGIANIIEAKDVETAMKSLDEARANLIITDRYMPGMDGLDFFKKLQEKEKLKSIPFLMTTAEHEKEKILDAMKLGIRNYIIKPIDPENLQLKVKRLLNLETEDPPL